MIWREDVRFRVFDFLAAEKACLVEAVADRWVGSLLALVFVLSGFLAADVLELETACLARSRAFSKRLFLPALGALPASSLDMKSPVN